MKKRQNQGLELLRVRYALAFMRAMEKDGVDSKLIWKDAGLAIEVLEDPEAWMPIDDLFCFLDVTAHLTGYATLGLDAGIAPRRKHSEFSLQTLLSPSLFEALSSICKLSNQEDTSAHFRLVREGPFFWMRCAPMLGREEGVRQVEFFRYAALLEIIRFVTDDNWLPPHIDFQSSFGHGMPDSTLLAGPKIRTGMPFMQFAIPPLFLSRPLNGIPNTPLGQSRFTPHLSDFQRVLLELVRYNVLSGKYRLQDMAKAMELSKRSFQRRLADQGITYSKLLLKVRIDTATVWLSEGIKSISEIADRLGYRECTNFSRTFRKINGVSPREFRRLMSVEHEG